MKSSLANQKRYTESSIQVLAGLEPVRKRPGMYIGSTDNNGMHHLLWEIVDNAIDEALAGFATQINVVVDRDGSVLVRDNGRGIPIGIHPATKLNVIETIFTTLHAGGKFGDGAYKVAGGLHGVGASVTNALSKWLRVQVKRDHKVMAMTFTKGGKVSRELRQITTTTSTGTEVQFCPDPEIFPQNSWNHTKISERLQESSFLINGLQITYHNKIIRKKIVYKSANGLVEYLQFLNQGSETISPTISFQETIDNVQVDVAVQWTTRFVEAIVSFANNIKTIDGGAHETGMKRALTQTINQFGHNFKILKENETLDGTDIREGLTAVIAVRLPEKILQFEGQTKTKLGSPAVRKLVEKTIHEKMIFWLQENKKSAEKILQKALQSFKARKASRKARDMVRKIRTSGDKSLSGKLTPAQSKTPKLTELFLVEGASAGGSAKQGRDRKYQAILPLRGKIINAERSKLYDLLKNEEILTIVSALGASVGEDFKIASCRYGKVIIMTDADVDGAHIQTLLLTFFYRQMRPLVDSGRLYLAMPPLYKLSLPKNQFTYLWDEAELANKIKNRQNYTIQRYKGLGEMNAEQLWETTMNPATRSLVQVQVADVMNIEKQIQTLMGADSQIRKNWINANVDFSLN